MSAAAEQSPYCRSPIETRGSDPLYQAVRTIVGKLSDGQSLSILDIGCSDGPAMTALQQDNHQVVGVDIDLQVLRQAKDRNAHNQIVLADATNLPFSDQSHFDVTVALNVLEHLPKDKSEGFLRRIAAMSSHQLIAVPIISPASVFTMRESALALKTKLASGQLPESGLFDRTHQLFWSMRQYEDLFRQSGLDINDRWIINPYEGVQGGELDIVRPDIDPKKYAAYMLATRKVIPAVLGLIDPTSTQDQRITDASIYLALYLLSPTPSDTSGDGLAEVASS